MTKSVILSRRIVRQTPLRERGRPLMVALAADGCAIELWAKGERTRYRVRFEAILMLAARQKADDSKAEKLRRRHERRERQAVVAPTRACRGF